MSITVQRRTKSTVRAEYSVALWAKRANRPRFSIGAPSDSAMPFSTVRRDTMLLYNLAQSLVSMDAEGNAVDLSDLARGVLMHRHVIHDHRATGEHHGRSEEHTS